MPRPSRAPLLVAPAVHRQHVVVVFQQKVLLARCESTCTDRYAYCCNRNVVSAVEMPPAPGSTVMRSLTDLARARASVFTSANPSGSTHDRRLNPLFTCGGSFRQR